MSAAKPLLAIDRVAIVMNLVPYLVERGPVSVTEAARELDVAPDVLRRLAEGLVVIGLPDGMHNDLFDIDWDLLDEHDELQLLNTVAFDRVSRPRASFRVSSRSSRAVRAQRPPS